MCVCVAFVSFSLYLSRSKTTCSQIGLVEKYPEPQLRKRRGKKIGPEELKEEISLRKKKKRQRRLATWAWHAISDFCLFVFVSFFCFFLCSISYFFSLSKPKSLFLSLFWSTMVVVGLVTLWAWVCWLIGVFDCLGSWAWFFWVHGFDFFGFGFLIIFLGLWVWLFSKKINKRKENIDYFNFLGKVSSSFL